MKSKKSRIITKVGSLRIRLKPLIIIVAVLLLIGGGIAYKHYQKKQDAIVAAEKLKYSVTRGDLTVEVKVSASAKLMNEQKLSFGQEGKIVAVNTRVGSEVKAGDILAELDMSDYENAIQAAELDLANAQLGLQKLLNNDTSVAEARVRSQIKEAEANYAVEQLAYNTLEQQLTTDLALKENNLDQAIREYNLAKKELEITGPGLHASAAETAAHEANAREQKVASLISELDTYLGTAEILVKAIDKIFGATESFRGPAQNYNIHLSAKDVNIKNTVKSDILSAYVMIASYQIQVDGLNSSSSNDEIYAITQGLYQDVNMLLTMCDLSQKALDKSMVSTTLTQNMVDAFAATISSTRTSVITLRTQIKALEDSLNSTLVSYETQKATLANMEENMRILTQNIAIQKNDIPNQLARKQAQLDALSESTSVLKKELNSLLDGADAYDIQQQRNLIRQAQLKLERTIDQEDDFQIIAEFDGRVRSVDITEGEQYKLDDREFIVIENPDLIELELEVSQIDIVKIEKGDPVRVTFDAHPNRPIDAIVSERNVTPQVNSRGGIYYEAKILLEKQDLEILAGMTALVSVTTAEHDDVLIIPSLSIIHEGEKTYVSKFESGDYKKHEVEIGITNNFQAEVLSGLVEGDVIKSSVLDDEVLSEMGVDQSNASIF